MFRKVSLTLISDNKTFKKKLNLLTKGKIADQTELKVKFTQIERNLNISRITIQSVLRRLETTFFEVNKPRSERFSVITFRAARALLRYVRINFKTT